MSRARRRRPALAALAALGAAFAAGCRSAPPAPPPPPPPPETFADVAARRWAAARDTVAELRSRGEDAQADSVLGRFRAEFPGTPAAIDALFQRALLRADPASRARAPQAAMDDLDAYAAGGPLHVHGAEAHVIRRLVADADSVRVAAAAERAAAAVLIPRDSLRPRDEEIARLRAELEQTKAELDRVRRRLAPPTRP